MHGRCWFPFWWPVRYWKLLPEQKPATCGTATENAELLIGSVVLNATHATTHAKLLVVEHVGLNSFVEASCMRGRSVK